jgi:2,3-dihydroxyphenylpropionate 1,2-dioxygenase
MAVALVCASHSPLMYCFARPPSCYERSEQLFAQRAEAIRAFDPELVVVFGPDHFNGFFLQLMPPFCVGLQCTAAADIGGFAGPLRVPTNDALACIDAVRTAGVDVAVSYDMIVDHGFSQTMFRMLGALDAYPVIPIFVSGIAPPYVPFRRSRLLGEAVGRFAASLGKRVLFLGSGGMSHNPTRYYPEYASGDPRVAGYQLSGGHGAGLSRTEWLERLDRMHREGAHMLVDGTRTRADLKLNPQVDAQFLAIITSGDLTRVDALEPAWMVERAGIGSLELHTWVAAAAANAAAGGDPAVVDLYAEALEYGIAFGMIHSG